MVRIKSFKIFESVSNIPTEDEVKYSLIDLYDLEYDIDINYYDVDKCYQIEIKSNKSPYIFNISDVKDSIITTIDFFSSKYDRFGYNLLYLECDEKYKMDMGEYIDIVGDLDIFFDNNDIDTNSVMLYLNF
jgi:hypothetical protein